MTYLEKLFVRYSLYEKRTIQEAIDIKILYEGFIFNKSLIYNITIVFKYGKVKDVVTNYANKDYRSEYLIDTICEISGEGKPFAFINNNTITEIPYGCGNSVINTNSFYSPYNQNIADIEECRLTITLTPKHGCIYSKLPIDEYAYLNLKDKQVVYDSFNSVKSCLSHHLNENEQSLYAKTIHGLIRKR